MKDNHQQTVMYCMCDRTGTASVGTYPNVANCQGRKQTFESAAQYEVSSDQHSPATFIVTYLAPKRTALLKLLMHV